MKPSTLAIGLITASAIKVIMTHASEANQKKKKANKKKEHPSQHHKDWNCVDEASWESFPASDPPGKY